MELKAVLFAAFFLICPLSAADSPAPKKERPIIKKEGELEELNTLFNDKFPGFTKLQNTQLRSWDGFAGFPYKELSDPSLSGVRNTARKMLISNLEYLMDSWYDQKLINGKSCPKFDPAEKFDRISQLDIPQVALYQELQRNFTLIYMGWYKGLSLNIRLGRSSKEIDSQELTAYVNDLKALKPTFDGLEERTQNFTKFWDSELSVLKCGVKDFLNFLTILPRFTFVLKKLPPTLFLATRYYASIEKANRYRKLINLIDKSMQTFFFFFAIFRETIGFASDLKSSVEIDENREFIMLNARVAIKMIDKISYNVNKVTTLLTKVGEIYRSVTKALGRLESRAGLQVPQTRYETLINLRSGVAALPWAALLGLGLVAILR